MRCVTVESAIYAHRHIKYFFSAAVTQFVASGTFEPFPEPTPTQVPRFGYRVFMPLKEKMRKLSTSSGTYVGTRLMASL